MDIADWVERSREGAELVPSLNFMPVALLQSLQQ